MGYSIQTKLMERHTGGGSKANVNILHSKLSVRYVSVYYYCHEKLSTCIHAYNTHLHSTCI